MARFRHPRRTGSASPLGGDRVQARFSRLRKSQIRNRDLCRWRTESDRYLGSQAARSSRDPGRVFRDLHSRPRHHILRAHAANRQAGGSVRPRAEHVTRGSRPRVRLLPRTHRTLPQAAFVEPGSDSRRSSRVRSDFQTACVRVVHSRSRVSISTAPCWSRSKFHPGSLEESWAESTNRCN